MKVSYAALPFESETPAPDEVGLLAGQFQEDNPPAGGREPDYRRTAEYMLTQRELIWYQLHLLHHRES